MDAVKFLEERKRMFKEGSLMPCLDGDIGYNSEKAVKIVEEWSAAHPRKTRQSAFLEQHPEAKVDGRNVLCVCPADIYGDIVCPNTAGIPCFGCRREFWLEEVE